MESAGSALESAAIGPTAAAPATPQEEIDPDIIGDDDDDMGGGKAKSSLRRVRAYNIKLGTMNLAAGPPMTMWLVTTPVSTTLVCLRQYPATFWASACLTNGGSSDHRGTA